MVLAKMQREALWRNEARIAGLRREQGLFETGVQNLEKQADGPWVDTTVEHARILETAIRQYEAISADLRMWLGEAAA